MDNTTNDKELCWAYIKCTPISKTSTVTYLGLVLGLFVKAPSSDFNQAPIYP